MVTGARKDYNEADSRPVNLTDAAATRLGHKVYLADKSGGTNDIAYNGTNKATISVVGGGNTLTTVLLANFIPYQMQDASWRVKFNIEVLVNSTTRTQLALAINGITFFDTLADGQAIAAFADTAGANAVQYCIAPAGSNNLQANHASVSTNRYVFSGDVKLASKPTWAY